MWDVGGVILGVLKLMLCFQLSGVHYLHVIRVYLNVSVPVVEYLRDI